MDELIKLLEEVSAGNELLNEKLNRVEAKLDSLFNDVPPYEQTKVEIPPPLRLRGTNSATIRRKLETYFREKAKHQQPA